MISVVVPTYNRYEKLCDLLHKLYQQTYKEFEVIVCDDCSSDKTPEITGLFPSVRYYKTPQNLGYAGNSIFGLEKAEGGHVIFLADDDMLEDDTFFEKAAQKLKSCDAVFGRSRTVCGELSNVSGYGFKEYYSGTEFVEEVMRLNFSFLDYFTFSSFIFSTEMFRRIKPFESVFMESSSGDISNIVKFALNAEVKIGFTDVVAYAWNRGTETSLSGVKKDDLIYQCIQSVTAGIDIYRFFEGGEKCREVCNGYVRYIFDAILSDYRQLDRFRHYNEVLNSVGAGGIYIYCCGWAGKELAVEAQKKNIRVAGFIDDIKSGDGSVMSFEDFKAVGGVKQVVIANYKYEPVYKIYKKLSKVEGTVIYDLLSFV